EDVCQAVLQELDPRIESPVDFAVINRVLLARTASGVPVDIGLAGFPFEAELIGRATPFEFDENVVIPTISAEDLIVLKAVANRGHDWDDIESIIVRQADRLDWSLVLDLLSSLADLIPEHDPLARLKAMRDWLHQEE
ncbi:MAG: nucleotidyltransferase, partial [Acidimicrobiales bacterium]